VTRIERLRAAQESAPADVWRAVKAWDDAPNATTAWAWFADQCGVYEADATNDPLALATANGMRAAFFLLWDMASADGDSVLDLQRQATREG